MSILDWNTGSRNTGNWNTGSWNTGNWNTGSWNTGSWNTGDRNTGYCNTGDRNTGDWNTGNRNTGYCNTSTPKVVIFNKQTDLEFSSINFPNFFYFETTEWIYESSMSDKEKTAFPTYVTTGGYLKEKSYVEAWRESWDKASLEDKKKVFALPNWDNDIFKQISGIDVEKELNTPKTLSGKEVKVTLDGVEYIATIK
jgi:hypothetical protein